MVMSYQARKILVTGGAGFIGANFIHHLLKKNSQITIVNFDSLTYAGSLQNLTNVPNNHNYHFILGDICNRALVERVLKQYNIDTLIHFAAESHVDRSITTPNAFIQTNIVGTFTLLEAARIFWFEELKLDHNECRFHHISTDEVYGSLTESEPPCNEQIPYAPSSPYAASKASSDHLVRSYFVTYALPVTITNCSNNYGFYQHSEKFIPTVIRACMNWQPIPIYGNGRNIRDWLYVLDHCEAIDLVIRKGKLGEKYNVGAHNELENLEVAKKICHIMNKLLPRNVPYEELISFVTDRKGHDWRYAIDYSKLANELSWQPKTSFEQGLQKTVEWYVSKVMSQEKQYG